MRRQVIYHGRVQGVGFRATASSIAGTYRVSGWVRNDPAGSVTLEVQGTEPEVRAYLSAIDGVMGRNIRATDEADVAEVEGERGFSVRYS